ncbi:MAG: helix-turn-helix transcriptional regulator [Solirubrobacterales bacterium]|nr:helix-turn-helix transcriptional regulator [Solirubrobacterales bacterium]
MTDLVADFETLGCELVDSDFLCDFAHARANMPTTALLGNIEPASWLLRGTPDKEIARRLVVSDHTAREHAKRVLQKLGVRTRTELAGQVFAEHCEPWWATSEDPPREG